MSLMLFLKAGLGDDGGRGAKQSFAGRHSQAELGNDRDESTPVGD